MGDLQVLLQRYALGAWRHRWIAVGVAWLLCLGGWAAVHFVPNVYEADARLYVDADAVLTPLLQGLALDNNADNQLEVLQRTLLSRPNLETLISRTDLDLQAATPIKKEEMVAQLGQAIKLSYQTRNLFTITYRSSNPQLAYDVVRGILNIFTEEKAGNSRSDMANARQFLQQQIDSYEQQLRVAELKRAEFRTKYVDLLPGEGGAASKLEDARAMVRSLQGQLTDTLAKRGRLEAELAATPQMIVTETDAAVAGSSGGGGGGELAAAQAKLQELLVSDTEDNPEVVFQRRLISELRKGGTASRGGGSAQPGVPARSRSAPNELYAQLKVELVNTDGDIASLTRQVADATRERDRLDQIARDVPGVEAQYTNLNRDYDVVRRNYDLLVGRREEMRLSSAAEDEAGKVKLQVVDPPLVPRVPAGPNRPLLLSGVLAMGLAGGLGLAGVLVQLDRSFWSLSELRSLGLPLAGSISIAAMPTTRRLARAWFGVAALALAVLLLCGVYGRLLMQVTRAAGSA
jgi:polysaccharide chain length determinant protein (PEP-CTERM system associated)